MKTEHTRLDKADWVVTTLDIYKRNEKCEYGEKRTAVQNVHRFFSSHTSKAVTNFQGLQASIKKKSCTSQPINLSKVLSVTGSHLQPRKH